MMPRVKSVLGCLMLVAGWGLLLPAVEASDRETAFLAFVDSLSVDIGPLPPELRNSGLRSHLLKADAERRLEEEGIPVRRDSTSRLYVGINGIRARNDTFYVFNLNVRLYQPVVLATEWKNALEENVRPKLVACTWSSGLTGYFRLYSDIRKVIEEAIQEEIARFVDDCKGATRGNERCVGGPGTPSNESAGANKVSPVELETEEDKGGLYVRTEAGVIAVYDSEGNLLLKSPSQDALESSGREKAALSAKGAFPLNPFGGIPFMPKDLP